MLNNICNDYNDYNNNNYYNRNNNSKNNTSFKFTNIQYKWLTNILIMTNYTLYVCYAKKTQNIRKYKVFFIKRKKNLIYCFFTSSLIFFSAILSKKEIP